MEINDTHYVGHRQRLKQKLLQALGEVADYELLEVLLFSAIPKKDEPLAKKILERFEDLSKLINAYKEKLLLIEGMNENICRSFYLVKELNRRILKSKVTKQNIISSWRALLDYLKSSMGILKNKQSRTLFQNKKNVLLTEEVIGVITIDQAPVYPREIVKRALSHEVGAVILVHNHLSLSSKPSKIDIVLTSKIVETCNSVNVTVHDHVIIAGNDYYSFKSNMLL